MNARCLICGMPVESQADHAPLHFAMPMPIHVAEIIPDSLEIDENGRLSINGYLIPDSPNGRARLAAALSARNANDRNN